MSEHEIKRFPRLPEGCTIETAPILYPNRHLTDTEKYEQRMLLAKYGLAKPPKGYDRLRKKYKKLARLIGAGWSIKDACKRVNVQHETFYRLRRAHPMFRAYLTKQIVANYTDVQARHGAQVLRAMQVVDEAMDLGDPYFAANIAKDVLKGRGEWKSSSTSTVQNTVNGKVGIETAIAVDDHGMTKGLLQTFVDGLVRMASGGLVHEKVITVGEDVKALPPATGS